MASAAITRVQALLLGLAASASLALAADGSSLVILNASAKPWHLTPVKGDPKAAPVGLLKVNDPGSDPLADKPRKSSAPELLSLDLAQGSELVLDLPDKQGGYRIWNLQDDQGATLFRVGIRVDPADTKVKRLLVLDLSGAMDSKLAAGFIPGKFFLDGPNYLVILADAWK